MHCKQELDKKERILNLLIWLDRACFYTYLLISARPHFFNDLMYRHRREISEGLRVRKYVARTVHAIGSTILAVRLTSGTYFSELTTIKAHYWLFSFYFVIAYLALRWLLPASPAVFGDTKPPTPTPSYENPFERAYNDVYEIGRSQGYSDGYSRGVSVGSCMRWR